MLLSSQERCQEYKVYRNLRFGGSNYLQVVNVYYYICTLLRDPRRDRPPEITTIPTSPFPSKRIGQAESVHDAGT